jgi:hypothetical protein
MERTHRNLRISKEVWKNRPGLYLETMGNVAIETQFLTGSFPCH